MEPKRIIKIPKFKKGAKVFYTKDTVKEEVEEYLSIDGYSMEMVKDHVEEFSKHIEDYDEYPVCILSHMFDPRRSKHLVALDEESKLHKLTKQYYIFTYSDQKDLYDRFNSIENITVVYIPTDKEEYSTLVGKRQYILEWNQNRNNTNAFFVEDDCDKLCLPVGQYGADGLKNFRNGRYMMSMNFAFGYWEFMIKKYDMKYSGLLNNMEFAFRDIGTEKALADPLTKGFIKKNAQVVQIVHINTKFCKDKNLKFDPNAGWDDYDFIIQQCVYGEGTRGLMMGYFTPALKSGVSAMSSDADALKIRCEKNSKELMGKWGMGLVREDTKKGLYNAKVNWHTLKKGLERGIDLRDIIGMSKEEAKKYVDTFGSDEVIESEVVTVKTDTDQLF